MTTDAKLAEIADCQTCGAKCCRYVAVQIDEPDTEDDYSDIRWYLCHKEVSVFIDHDDSWYIQFNTPCEFLKKDNTCGVYESRPGICREHDPADCEAVDGSESQKFLLQNVDDLDMYLKLKGKRIRWRK